MGSGVQLGISRAISAPGRRQTQAIQNVCRRFVGPDGVPQADKDIDTAQMKRQKLHLKLSCQAGERVFQQLIQQQGHRQRDQHALFACGIHFFVQGAADDPKRHRNGKPGKMRGVKQLKRCKFFAKKLFIRLCRPKKFGQLLPIPHGSYPLFFHT